MKRDPPTQKPPLGLVPHEVWVNRRCLEIMRAIIRADDAGGVSDAEWWHELRRHIGQLLS